MAFRPFIDVLREDYGCTDENVISHIRMIRTWRRPFVFEGECEPNAHLFAQQIKYTKCYRCSAVSDSKISWKLNRYGIALYNNVCFECVGNVLRGGRWFQA